MKQVRFALLAALLTMVPAITFASPIYVAGDQCPSNAQMPDYTRQYTVIDAVACVFDPDSSNIQGGQADLDAYFGSGWTGLLQEKHGESDINGFEYTADAGNDDGTFTIGLPLTSMYSQFAIGIKDGDAPKWAIFLLGIGVTEGQWSFLTQGGDLSHFTLYGRTSNVIDPRCTLPQICGGSDDPPPSVPDGGATIAMLGAVMFGLGYARRKFAQ